MAKPKETSKTLLSPDVEARFQSVESRLAALEGDDTETAPAALTAEQQKAADNRAAAQALLDEANKLDPK